MLWAPVKVKLMTKEENSEGTDNKTNHPGGRRLFLNRITGFISFFAEASPEVESQLKIRVKIYKDAWNQISFKITCYF